MFDAVKLPCGHVVGREGLKRWHKMGQNHCFRDRITFQLSEVVADEEPRRKVSETYPDYLRRVKAFNSLLDDKVRQLNLDDRGYELREVATVAERKGVTLFLKKESTLERVVQIAKILNLYDEPSPDAPFKKNVIYINGYMYPTNYHSIPLENLTNRDKSILKIFIL